MTTITIVQASVTQASERIKAIQAEAVAPGITEAEYMALADEQDALIEQVLEPAGYFFNYHTMQAERERDNLSRNSLEFWEMFTFARYHHKALAERLDACNDYLNMIRGLDHTTRQEYDQAMNARNEAWRQLCEVYDAWRDRDREGRA